MIGLSELGLILVLAIILLKPKDYLSIIKNIHTYYYRIKEYFYRLKDEIYDVGFTDLKSQIDDFHKRSEEFKEKFKEEFLIIDNKKYIYGEDKQLHEIYDIKKPPTKD